MHKNENKQSVPSWTGMIAVEDTAWALTDTGGEGIPVVYLNGSFADQSHREKVIAALGPGWRHITYDERARGKSQLSADYSFEACIRDLDAVLLARGIDRPLLVGWSYGAVVAVHWASRNPKCIRGVVSVDGAYPYTWIDDAAKERIHKLFRQLGWTFPLASRIGLAAKFSPKVHAEMNIEISEIQGGSRSSTRKLNVSSLLRGRTGRPPWW